MNAEAIENLHAEIWRMAYMCERSLLWAVAERDQLRVESAAEQRQQAARFSARAFELAQNLPIKGRGDIAEPITTVAADDAAHYPE